VNVPPIIGMVLSRSANPVQALELLRTKMSVEDVHDLIEVILIDDHNSRKLAKAAAQRDEDAVRSR